MQTNILALQFRAELCDKTANFAKVEAMIGNALSEGAAFGSSGGADIILLPEVWQTGWVCESFPEAAEPDSIGGTTIEFLSALARKYNVNIVGGSYIKKTENGLRNSCPVVSRTGEILAHYDKNHLFTPDGEAKHITRGENILAVELEGLKVGLSICYDIRFPELFRAYDCGDMPHLLVNMAAWPKTRAHHYSTLCTARAIENQAYFLGLSQSGEIKNGVYNAGQSLLVSPFGDVIQKLGEDEGYIFQTIDTDEVEKIRADYPNLKECRTEGYKKICKSF